MVISPIFYVYSKMDKTRYISAHFEQHFNGTTPSTYIRKCMAFKVVNQINPVGAMKNFTKPNCNLCMEERLTILNNICDKYVTVMNKK